MCLKLYSFAELKKTIIISKYNLISDYFTIFWKFSLKPINVLYCLWISWSNPPPPPNPFYASQGVRGVPVSAVGKVVLAVESNLPWN